MPSCSKLTRTSRGLRTVRVPASCVLHIPEAQGSLPPGPHYCTYAAHVPASGVPYVPCSVAPQVLLVVSLVLPHCPGCYFVVAAFGVAELGSASIAVDAEWRRRGGSSRGLKLSMVKVLPGQCPSSALCPLTARLVALTGSALSGEKLGHWAPVHCLGCSS